MSVLTTAGGQVILTSGGQAITPAAPPALYAYSGAHPADIAGLLHWWDAGSAAQLRTSGGAVPASYAAAALLVNKVAGGPAITLGTSSANPNSYPNGYVWTPRMVGNEGGLGATLNSTYGPVAPAMDLNIQQVAINTAFGGDVARTIHFVWTRANLRYNVYTPGYSPGAISLLRIGPTPILTVTNTGSADTLAFGSTTLGTVTRRHTHSVTMRWAAGGAVDVWLDDTQVATAAANLLGAGVTGHIYPCGYDDATGNAGTHLHELAVWDHALSSADMTTLVGSATSVSKRWARGARKLPTIIDIGQSNQGYFQADAEFQFQEAIRYHLGAVGVNLITGQNRTPKLPGSGTLYGGVGLYSTSPGTFLLDPGNGSDPSTWGNGPDGTQVDAAIGGLSAMDLADVAGVWWNYMENDSQRSYAEKATFAKAKRQYVTHLRALAGKTPAQMPLLDISGMAFAGLIAPAGAGGYLGGIQAMRETEADLAGDGTFVSAIVLPNTTDVFGRGYTDGTGAGGDPSHISPVDNVRHAYLAGPVAARALIAAGWGDAGVTVPAGIPVVGGPHIVSAVRQSGTTILVTIAHDAGTNLILPGNAAAGAGWTLCDGWASPTSTGALIGVSTVARQSATTLLLTLASAMTNAASACRLWYPLGNQHIGQGSAVTDNYSAMPRPLGFNPVADLGAGAAPNCPLAVPAYGVQLS